MSRSKHTDPRSVRAARRVRSPFETRVTGDLSLRRKLGQKLKGLNNISEASAKGVTSSNLRPRIVWREPSPGFRHPIGKQDVLLLLEAIGPVAIYGLRSIELTRAIVRKGARLPVFGQYQVPGRILLFAQPLPPWRLPGLLAKKDTERFERAGAVVSARPQLGATFVEWPGDTLRRFMLEDVLLHELGHHVLQYHKGKRFARIARTKDHEAFAALFAERQRSRLADRRLATE